MINENSVQPIEENYFNNFKTMFHSFSYGINSASNISVLIVLGVLFNSEILFLVRDRVKIVFD